MIAQNCERSDDISVEGEFEHLAVEISTESFHKVIDELIDNAIKFSDKGAKIIVRMSIKNNFMYISIIDQGRGMSKEQIENIGAYIQFERTIYEQQGVGLGLVISKRIVELHDGEFEIHSVEGKGTTISFSLPCQTIA